MPKFFVHDKGQYFDIGIKGFVVCRIPRRLKPSYGLTDKDRALKLAELFEENSERVLYGAQPETAE